MKAKDITRIAAAVALPVIAVGGFAGSASAEGTAAASTVSVVQGVVLINGTDTVNRISVYADGGRVFVEDGSGLAAGRGCELFGASGRIAVCSSYGGIVANLHGGTDTFVSKWATHGYVNGGAGDDIFEAGVADGRSAIQFQGGIGRDTVTYVRATGPVYATLASAKTPTEGAFNDGRIGDADALGGDIEAVTGSDHNDRIVGNELNNAIIGGRGRDIMYGELGQDTLHAHDSAVDLAVNCGGGQDIAVADRSDPVTSSCESVRNP